MLTKQQQALFEASCNEQVDLTETIKDFKPWFSYGGLELSYYKAKSNNEQEYWDEAMSLLRQGRGLYFNIITGEVR
jgi:hypothetical protein